MMDLKDGNLRALELKISSEFNLALFNPYGNSTFIDSNDTVKIFKYEDENSLLHLKTIKYELLPSVNYLIAFDLHIFMLPITSCFSDSFSKYLKTCLNLLWTNDVY